MSRQALFEDSGLCRVLDSEGLEVSCFPTIYEPAFNGQYPPLFSPDESVLYVGSWERGLFCYQVSKGQLLWRQGPGKVRRAFPFDDGVVVEMAGRGLYRRTQATGELTGTVKMGGMETARRLDSSRLFAGPCYRHYHVYSIPGLESLERIHESRLNPEDCLSFVIRDVFLLENRLYVEGSEQFPHRDYSAKGQRRFSRYFRLGDA